ncbi:glycosyltransferase [Flavobacterium saccharophilum]|uniref:Glycosyltransferase involved in cell wall bisynthesis n=1 Tax=Flavobacterium saccharophilum TaxID=29534 RepID=A0A1M7K6F9_9FLAO|nr:glycosyltransferase [Flavobacterium saccharophilum]SHM60765.1 Glycosyltransferase involved in cell wall bisynthesis [Flavobacterium saccharophilum]
MKIAIITNVIHQKQEGYYYGYAPYVGEINIWLKYVDEVIVVAPLNKATPSRIDIPYQIANVDFRKVSEFSFTNFKNNIISIFKIPVISWKIFCAMKTVGHIHLRCPGNTGLLACFIQILFPGKNKTAKYAGNWDPKSKQPWTYKLQKWILNNTFITRNMTVLVYGEWENQSKNIKSFFTATYSETEKRVIEKTDFKSIIEFIFVGSLVSGKDPMYAVKLIQSLIEKGKNVVLNLYGEGKERTALEHYIKVNQLENSVFLHGNQNKEVLKKAYQKSHFVVLPSKSEGWPKAIAEGMFWGCIPVATKVSCVPYMLDYGRRGVLLEMDLEKDIIQLENLILDNDQLQDKIKLASNWSQGYTTDRFEAEIKKLLK